MATPLFQSWGRFPKLRHRGAIVPATEEELRTALNETPEPLLPRGLGRSYGDSCLNADGYLVDMTAMNQTRSFDPRTGILRCEAGVSLARILQEFVPRGWFLPVSPGTKYVTVGGAIANDIHGKNHHGAGSFGNHVLQFELLRSDGTTLLCSESSNPDWFRATIGGLGLTGCIVWADIRLKPVRGPYILQERIRFLGLDEFADISRASTTDYEYTVAWVDCLSRRRPGRGVFFRGNHADDFEPNIRRAVHKNRAWKTVPCPLPTIALNPLSMKLFNGLYYHTQPKRCRTDRVHYDKFFYPLDGVQNWNRLYGPRGFLQWQCVVPKSGGYDALKAILEQITRSQLGSFLAVLKEFGDVPPLGLLSFPMPGITLALDFAHAGNRLTALLDRLDSIVVDAGGRIYPAKDARMSPAAFLAGYPSAADFPQYVDPKISSSFYRRVAGHVSAGSTAKKGPAELRTGSAPGGRIANYDVAPRIDLHEDNG